MARNKLNHTARPAAAHSQGFTLIEILVVVSLSIILMIGAAGLFFTTLITNTKKDILTQVKDEGEYALNQMEFLLRNAVALVPDPAFPTAAVCEPGMTRISLRSIDEGITTLSNDAGRIASQSAASATSKYLTSSGVILSGPTFDCQQSGTNYGSYVTITFTLQKDSPDVNRPAPVQEKFTTSVNVRSY